MDFNNDIMRKILRYAFMLILTWIGIVYITAGKLDTCDIVTLLMFIIICFMFIDMYYPAVYFPID